jgi:hypothetical protein
VSAVVDRGLSAAGNGGVVADGVGVADGFAVSGV